MFSFSKHGISKHRPNFILALSLALLAIAACKDSSPERIFDVAVLNTNMMAGFAGSGMERELEQPTVMMVDGDINKTAPMKRKEIVDGKISFVEENLEKLEALKVTDDSKELITTSLNLHNYVMAVYRNEYQQLAKIYDGGGSTGQAATLTNTIREKYYPKFEALMNELTVAGKAFASRHNIQVNWGVGG